MDAVACSDTTKSHPPITWAPQATDMGTLISNMESSIRHIQKEYCQGYETVRNQAKIFAEEEHKKGKSWRIIPEIVFRLLEGHFAPMNPDPDEVKRRQPESRRERFGRKFSFRGKSNKKTQSGDVPSTDS